MIIKKIDPINELTFTRGAYYWLMFMIDQYQSARRMLKIDYESFIIIQTIISHFLHSMNKEENADWKRMWELVSDEKAKDKFSKSKLIIYSVSLVVGLPKEKVRRKILELNKKKY